MKIRLTQSDYDAIVSHAREKAPNEACGLIGGTIEGDVKTIRKVFFLTNLDASPEHFSLDPREQFAVIKELRQNGWELLGNWHSHPATPSRPSEEDKRLAFDPNMSYLILSLQDLEPVLHSFRIPRDKNATREELEII